MRNPITLLDGATITVMQDPPGKFTATVIVGYTSKRATADDPVKALGLAVLLQAGFTESKLKAALLKGGSE